MCKVLNKNCIYFIFQLNSVSLSSYAKKKRTASPIRTFYF